MNTATTPDTELRSALDALETSLATPIVGGEMHAWADQVRATWADANDHLQQQLGELHPKQFKEISKQDPELSREVEKLRAEDAALETERAALSRFVDELAHVAPLVEPDERKVNDVAERLIKAGIAFVARVKKQQVAANTWFMEAFNRDRGTAD